MTATRFTLILAATTLLFAVVQAPAQAQPASFGAGEWPNYGNDPGAQRFSPLNQIDRDNVGRLKVAWVYHTGEVSNGDTTRMKTGFENTPIMVDGTMYISTPFNRVIALDPQSGAEKWSFDPGLKLKEIFSEGLINRGVSSWVDLSRRDGEACQRRIYIGTIDARLIALDAATGKLCGDFGADGEVNLKAGIKNADHLGYYGEYEETSPPAIIDGLVIVGSAVGDNRAVEEPLGTVRAFDARRGTLRWSWDPIPQSKADPAWRQWQAEDAQHTGAANTWAPISVDPEHHLVFLPVGSASPDYYGGARRGAGLYSDSLVALDSRTGKLKWSFQTTHHDIWDYDNPSQPLLCTIRRDGEQIPAVVQGTKRGQLFVFNRLSGEPLFPIVEKPVPQSDVAGEETSLTQPFPELPPPLIPQSLSADDAWGVMYFDRMDCRKRMAKLRSEGVYTPPSVRGSLVVPGNVGGMNWSGAAFDPERQLLITNVNNLAAEVHLVPRAELQQQINLSRGFDLEFAPQLGTPYGMSRTFMRSNVFPKLFCTPPPWGKLVGVDLSSGQIRWSEPFGNAGAAVKALLPFALPDPGWGTPSLGGTIVTAGGLVFIGGAMGDPHFRAFDVESGKLLWTGDLPAAGNATPMTYSINGKQYVVIAAGGHAKFDAPRSDALVAFSLAGDSASK